MVSCFSSESSSSIQYLLETEIVKKRLSTRKKKKKENQKIKKSKDKQFIIFNFFFCLKNKFTFQNYIVESYCYYLIIDCYWFGKFSWFTVIPFSLIKKFSLSIELYLCPSQGFFLLDPRSFYGASMLSPPDELTTPVRLSGHFQLKRVVSYL